MLPERRSLIINMSEKTARQEKIDDKETIGILDYAVDLHLNKYESYKHDVFSPKNALVFGVGLLAYSNLPGTHRLIFAARSPLWQGFFVSTMGGAGYVFKDLGINFCVIEGKAEKPTIIRILNDGEIKVEFFGIDKDKLMSIYHGYKGKIGFKALEQYVYDHYSSVFEEKDLPLRIISVGPASFNTRYGCICSTVTRSRKFEEGIHEFAGRGGLGSVMVQAHNVIAIIYGGNQKIKHDKLYDNEFIDSIFKEHFGKKMIEVVLEKGKKYRYDEGKGTGGTFGVNLATLKSWLLFLNWNSIYWDEEKRKEAYEKLIKNHYLKQFNEEVIKNQQFTNCGEPCPILCKKYSNGHKKDYEPYEANGPNAGVVDLRAAERIVSFIDAMGFDAIQAGTTISWIMELMQREILKPEDFELKKMPVFDIDEINAETSALNAEIMVKIAKEIAYGEGFGKIFGDGIKAAAEVLERMFDSNSDKKRIRDYAVYAVYGTKGEIAPCQYWVPAFFIPLPIQGKFLTNYHMKWFEPYVLGKSSAERTIKEMYSDNNGLCRFHRGWAEELLEVIFEKAFGEKIDFYEHHRKLAQKIILFDERCGLKPTFWESEKVVDVVATYLKKLKIEGETSKSLDEWIERFEKDKWSAAKSYWLDVLKGFENEIGVSRVIKVE